MYACCFLFRWPAHGWVLRVQHAAAPMAKNIVDNKCCGFPMKCAINCCRHLLKQKNMENMFFCPHHICTTCPCADSQCQLACSAACFYVRVVFNYSDMLKNIETLELNNTDGHVCAMRNM